MRFFSRWRRASLRYFVLLDNQGICRALKRAREQPKSGLWIETCDHHLAWLNRPLPSQARSQP